MTQRGTTTQAALLCGIAGYADVFGYVTLGGVFAANMTGNTVLLTIALVGGEWYGAVPYSITLTSFFGGAIFASVLSRVTRRPFAGFFLEAALLAAICMAPMSGPIALALLSAGMGVQAVTITRFGRTSLQTVVVTGTIAKLADDLIDRAWPPTRAGGDAAETAPVEIFTFAWIGYGVGAAAGVAAVTHIPVPLVVPALLLLIFVVRDAVADWRQVR
jgi:uncharacterized membrane protein YoaK (UPF0700 family)